MKKKQILIVALAVLLLCTLSVAGTLAFLTASKSGNDAVVNTFVAAGGGVLIVDNNFVLNESKATYENYNYTLDTSDKVTTNDYSNVSPEMVIPKDPKVTVDLSEGIDAYIFVKIIDEADPNLTYTVDSVWSPIANKDGLYLYNGTATTGSSNVDLNAVSILDDDQVTAAESFTDKNDTEDDVQLGSLTFEAYVCQAGGFTDAAAAFDACFPAPSTPTT